MNILHITGHLGGGIGTTVLDWLETDKSHKYWLHSLDYINDQAKHRLDNMDYGNYSQGKLEPARWETLYKWADIVVVHWWDNPYLDEWIRMRMPAGRVVFWYHQSYGLDPRIIGYPDRFIATSPVMGRRFDYIKSTGNISKFLKLQHQTSHDKFIVGYVGTADYKKIHRGFLDMCRRINIPNVLFIICGEDHLDISRNITGLDISKFWPIGKVSDTREYYSLFDVFGYPLRPDHYGTSELVLGEAMASGVVPVCMNNPAERLIIEDGVTGFLCKCEAEYIENVEHLYHKPLLRAYMGNNAREAAREMYDIDRMVREWNHVFEEIIVEWPKIERDPVGTELDKITEGYYGESGRNNYGK